MTSLAQNILENFQKVTETEAKPSRSDENLNTLFYNGKAIEKEIQTEQTGEFPSWISGRVYQAMQGSLFTIVSLPYFGIKIVICRHDLGSRSLTMR